MATINVLKNDISRAACDMSCPRGHNVLGMKNHRCMPNMCQCGQGFAKSGCCGEVQNA